VLISSAEKYGAATLSNMTVFVFGSKPPSAKDGAGATMNALYDDEYEGRPEALDAALGNTEWLRWFDHAPDSCISDMAYGAHQGATPLSPEWYYYWFVYEAFFGAPS